MPTKNCINCGEQFDAYSNRTAVCVHCKSIRQRQYQRNYREKIVKPNINIGVKREYLRNRAAEERHANKESLETVKTKREMPFVTVSTIENSHDGKLARLLSDIAAGRVGIARVK